MSFYATTGQDAGKPPRVFFRVRARYRRSIPKRALELNESECSQRERERESRVKSKSHVHHPVGKWRDVTLHIGMHVRASGVGLELVCCLGTCVASEKRGFEPCRKEVSKYLGSRQLVQAL
jgi:hypothetical protein